jgi:hypothetical protein
MVSEGKPLRKSADIAEYHNVLTKFLTEGFDDGG